MWFSQQCQISKDLPSLSLSIVWSLTNCALWKNPSGIIETWAWELRKATGGRSAWSWSSELVLALGRTCLSLTRDRETLSQAGSPSAGGWARGVQSLVWREQELTALPGRRRGQGVWSSWRCLMWGGWHCFALSRSRGYSWLWSRSDGKLGFAHLPRRDASLRQ